MCFVKSTPGLKPKTSVTQFVYSTTVNLKLTEIYCGFAAVTVDTGPVGGEPFCTTATFFGFSLETSNHQLGSTNCNDFMLLEPEWCRQITVPSHEYHMTAKGAPLATCLDNFQFLKNDLTM